MREGVGIYVEGMREGEGVETVIGNMYNKNCFILKKYKIMFTGWEVDRQMPFQGNSFLRAASQSRISTRSNCL